MGFFRFYIRVFSESFRHSLSIAQTVIFVLVICSGLIIYLYSPARSIIEVANLNGWKIAICVIALIVFLRLIFAPYWLFKAEAAQLSVAIETLSRISEDRPFNYVNIAPRVVGTNFHQTPIWTVERIELLFQNLGERIISYKILELFWVYNDKKAIIALPPDSGGYIHARQQVTYGFDINDLSVSVFPVILLIGFRIEYDNVPPLLNRGTRRIIQYKFRSFRPMYWDADIIEKDEY